MKRILSIFVYALAIAFNSIAQEKAKVVVNGLRICEFYSREQMYEALGGVPDKTEESIEFKGFYDFHYGKDVFYWNNNYTPNENGLDHYFGGCQIYTDRYVVFDSIRVGDPISKLSALHGGKQKICRNWDVWSGIHRKPKEIATIWMFVFIITKQVVQ